MNNKNREDIIKLIGADIEYDISKEGTLEPEGSPQFQSLIRSRATTMVEEYERSLRPGFWYGVWQSVTGNFIWLIILAILAFILAMASLNIWDLMIDSIAEKLKTTP